MADPSAMSPEQLRDRVREFLATHPVTGDRFEFLRERFDAGLAWVRFPVGHGGLGLPQAWQPEVDNMFVAAGAPSNRPGVSGIGLGMVAPTIPCLRDAGAEGPLPAADLHVRGDLVSALQ